MKVLFLSTLYAPNLMGGAERVVQSITEGLEEEGHRTVVVSTAPRSEARTGRINGVKVYYVGQRNVYYWPRRGKPSPTLRKPLWHGLDTYNPLMAREVGRILDAERPDVVHTNVLANFSPLVWQAAKRRGLPLVHTLHDYYLLCPKATMLRRGSNCAGRCAACLPYSVSRRNLSNLVDVVVGTSRFTLERHLQLGCFAATPERAVIHNACPAAPLAPLAPVRSEFVTFGYLGRLHSTKGLETLLDPVGKLPDGGWNLKVGGEGPAAYERHLRARFDAPPVEFLGRVDPDVFLASVDVLVVPSLWHDPSPRVISEAYAQGMPVIGSNRGGIPELIDDGRTGFLFDPDRPGDLTARMRRFVAEPALVSDMRAACLKKSESLPPKRVVELYLELYSSAARAAR